MTTEARLAQKRKANAAYRKRHPERVRAVLARWYANNQAHVRAYREAHVAEARAWRANYSLRRHGLTADAYADLLARQAFGCAICRRPESTFPSGRTRRLDIDHDHACCPGKRSCGACIRGLLCSDCNRGRFWFDPSVLRAAAAYFEARSNV